SAALLAAHVAGDAQSSPTAAVKAGVKCDEFVLAAVQAGQLHGAFNGFGAAVAEESFGEIAGSDVCNLFGKVGDRLHVIQVGGAVDQLIHLRLGSGNDLGIAMSSVHDRNSGEAVEILAAVHVGHDGAVGAIDHNRRNRLQKAGHNVVFVLLNSVGHECLWSSVVG